MVGVGPAGPGPSYVVAGTVDAAGTVAAHNVFLVAVVGAVHDDAGAAVEYDAVGSGRGTTVACQQPRALVDVAVRCAQNLHRQTAKCDG